MPPLILRIFAVIGFLATLLVVIAGLLLLRLETAVPSEPDNAVLVLDLDQPIVERSEESPLNLAIREQSVPLFDILRAIDGARNDPHVKGLVARFGSAQPSLAQAQEIRAALARFRTGGKFTYAFGSTYGGFGLGNRAYYLASGFENIWLQPAGSVGLMNAALTAPFAKTALDKIGVGADFMRREEYKSVMETAARDDFSPPVRANMQSMLDDLSDQVAAGVAEGRNWNVDRVKRLIAAGPYTAEEALKAGLVTRIGYVDELDKELEQKAGADVQRVSLDEYLSFGSGVKGKPKARVALIYGTGMITDRTSGPAGLAGEEIMGADKIAGAFDAAAGSKAVKAIIFRIDSPGGSPEASETIRRAVVHAREAGKPVFVSMGNVAASGGYWIAMNADQIIAEPGTLTGSIGVVAGKFVLGGLMQKLGIKWETLTTGGNAGMWSMLDSFSPEQRARVNALLDATYHEFVKNVSEARKIPMDKMPGVAKGRVFTGAQAVKIGLVDTLGGYDVALAAVRKKLDLKPDDVMAIDLFPPLLTPAERVLRILKGIGIEGVMFRTALLEWQKMQALIGPVWSELGGFGNPVTARIPAVALRAVESR